MKNILGFFSLIIIFSCNTSSPNTLLKTDSVLSVLNKTGDKRGDVNFLNHPTNGYVVVLAPTLVDNNVFDVGLHTAGVYTYLENEKNGGVQTILVSQEQPDIFEQFIQKFKTEKPDLFSKLTFINDTTKQLVKTLEINSIHLDHAGEAIAFDKEGTPLYHLDEYRCQGEKLQRLHQTYYPRIIDEFTAPTYTIEMGKALPKELHKYVGHYLGKQNILMTFYPSPLSHACSIQMDDFTHFSEKKNLKMFGVSIGSDEQVNAWKMNQYVGLELVADSTGIISNDFNSILKDENGIIYSDRTVFLIDKEGIVTYINQDYDVKADLTNLENAILAL